MNDSRDTNYVWNELDNTASKSYPCGSTGPNLPTRLRHSGSLVYWGSCQNENSGTWFHEFDFGAHMEYERKRSCSSGYEFEPYNGIEQHSLTIDNHDTANTTINPPQQNDDVGIQPAPSGGVDQDWVNATTTVIGEAIDYLGGAPITATAQVVGALLNDGSSDGDDGGEVKYDWQFPLEKYHACGSHFLHFIVNGGDTADFLLEDEGLSYPDSTLLSWDISWTPYNDSCGGLSSIESNSTTSSRDDCSKQNVLRKDVELGDVVTSKSGKK